MAAFPVSGINIHEGKARSASIRFGGTSPTSEKSVTAMSFSQPEPENEILDSKHETPPGDAARVGVVRSAAESDSRRAHKNPIASLRARSREKARERRLRAATLLRSLTAVLIGSLILRVAAQMMGLMLQSYFTAIGVPLAVMGFVAASFFLAELLGAPVFGALSDRYGRKKFILLGPIFGAIAVQITAMTTMLWLLIVTRLLEGLSTASAVPATLGYISEATSGRPKLRARIVGLFEITFVGGMAIGAGIGGFVWEYFGKEATVAGLRLTSPAFSVNGLIYLVSLAIFAYGLKNVGGGSAAANEPEQQNKWGHYKAILKSPRVWILVPAWLAINAVIGMWFNFSIRMLTEDRYNHLFSDQVLLGRWRGAERTVYIGFGVVLAAFTSGVLAWSFIMGRYRKTSVMLMATGGLAAILPSIYLINHSDSFYTTNFYLLVGVAMLGILVMSGFAPAALTYLADVTELHAEDRGSIMGLYSVFLGIGQLIGVSTGGAFAEWRGIDGLLLLSAIFGAITALSLLSLHRRNSLSISQTAAL
jgi:MFS family permease